MQKSDQTTSIASSTAVDTGFQPERYWASGAHPREVEIASVNWPDVRTYYLDAHPVKAGITYKWRVDGDGSVVPPKLGPTEQPMDLDELMTALEENCLPEFSGGTLENAWDQAWYAAQDNLDLSDSEAMGYALDDVSEAYTFTSDFYPTLSDLYAERFQAWRDQQKIADE